MATNIEHLAETTKSWGKPGSNLVESSPRPTANTPVWDPVQLIHDRGARRDLGFGLSRRSVNSPS
jgi:hypothetical protein